ncbi:MAG TPA: diguanylate cyclase [Patescibacteria group bacterium]|nr:diguanylate cyclase [Patescibacteria group bacterium]
MWFLLAIGLLVGDAALVYRSYERLDAQKNLVFHTYEVIGEITSIVSRLKDVQSSQRGYVITGRPEYLAPYSAARSVINDSLQRLETLVGDNPAQEKNAQVLRADAEKRIAIAAEIIEVHDRQGRDAAFALISTGKGEREMEAITHAAAGMVAIERGLLAERQAKAEEAAELTLAIGGGGAVLCVLILGGVFLVVHREAQRREKAEKEAQGALAVLQRVADQDRQISHMSDYLQSCRSVKEAHDVISSSVLKILPGTTGEIALFNNSRNRLDPAVSWGGEEYMSSGFAPERCWALRRGQMHHVIPGGSEPLCGHIPAMPPGGAICFPMQAQGETIGCLTLVSDEPSDMGAQTEKAVRRAGEQIALALSNLRLQEKLRDQSVRDPLTHLFNRRYLEETMERELDRARRKELPLGLMVLDIDHFKKYNDSRGHDAGDALLAQFAKLLMEQIRQEDIACRYGGEEFVVVMPGAGVEITEARAKKICEAVRNMKVTLGGESFGGVTVSIGVSSYPAHGIRMEELVSAADKALYGAKHGGRDQVRLAVAE